MGPVAIGVWRLALGERCVRMFGVKVVESEEN